MVTRRDAMASTIITASAGLLSATQAQAATATSVNNNLSKGAELLRAGPLMNLERAYQVMAEENLDGLVMAHPTNVYHLTGYWDHVSIRHDAPVSFVLLARDARQAPGVVMGQFLYYYSFADSPLDSPLQTFLFTGWDTKLGDAAAIARLPDAQVKASPMAIFPDMHQAPQSNIELRHMAKLNAALNQRPLEANAERALAKAAREMGLDKGRIGYDHPIVAGSYETAGLTASMVYADRTIRKIRMIKSPREIEMMRLAARANAEAALAAVKTARAGATHRELRATFFAEAAKRGNTGVFMQLDTVMAETSEDTFVDGSAFSIDCVSLGFRYFGDYGRTIFVGEPSRSMKRGTDAISFAWDAVRERLKPGVRYSDIKKIGVEALKKAGYDFDVAFTPHSVGLAHTDEPGVGSSTAFWMKDDLVLQENMILSVDLPIKQSGLGGSAHLEDLTLITKNGAEQINDIGERTVMV